MLDPIATKPPWSVFTRAMGIPDRRNVLGFTGRAIGGYMFCLWHKRLDQLISGKMLSLAKGKACKCPECNSGSTIVFICFQSANGTIGSVKVSDWRTAFKSTNGRFMNTFENHKQVNK
ncbi:hypothetical protein LZF95_07470, partial [Algoriphagus sp. AGSA1]|uniref:hypothetical protein n=1 Tax=Algoriphagus sp. AGSA1 TaxID=2907213 RepID=UPI001F2EBEA0